MTIATKLDAAIKAVCPIHGVSIGRKDDKQTWRIDFKDDATEPQKTAAQAVVDAFNVAAAEIPPDQADIDNIQKQLKALALVVAQWNGKTVQQLKAAFRAAMDSLP